MSTESRKQPPIWGVIPAAGIGQRMQSAVPKQYLSLHNKTILQHSCERLLTLDAVCGLVVAVREDDRRWADVAQALSAQHSKPVVTVSGGRERADSVLNALQYLLQTQAGDEWVLVHDAVRPCVRADDILRLIDTALASEQHGALLAMPVRDTMKRANASGQVAATVEREHLWHALTPQCFPLEVLSRALEQAAQQGFSVTDESSAMEHAGFQPQLVQGADDNIKITRPDDLGLAERSLSEYKI